MKLSEILVSEYLYKRIDEFFSLTKEQKKIFKESLFEGIKGKDTEIQEFVDDNKTSLPIAGNNYYPLGITFLIGFDQIEIIYSNQLLIYIKQTNDKFVYSNGIKNITFPLSFNHPMVIEETFHYTDIDELQQFRRMVELKFGDCKISEHKL